MTEWRAEINRKALARLDRALPAVFPRPALIHALGRRFTPPMPRLAIDSYWRAPPGRADPLPPAPSAPRGGPPRRAWRLPPGKRGPGERRGPEGGASGAGLAWATFPGSPPAPIAR